MKTDPKKRRPRKQEAKAAPSYTFHLVSDKTGGLADHMLKAVLSQFPDLHCVKEIHTFCDSVEKLDAVARAFRSPKSLVFFALVEPELGQRLRQLCQAKGVPAFDLTSSLADFVAEQTGVEPSNDPQLIHQHSDEYFRRIDALEFTLQHDDSRRLESVHLADVVLVGLSRVSKTPTSALLGSLGYKAANVSIVPKSGFPEELKKCKGKVVALTIAPKRLHEIRSRRFELNRFADKADQLGGDEFGYLNLRDVIREVAAAEAEYRRRKYPQVNITHLTVEETAASVLDALKLRRGR